MRLALFEPDIPQNTGAVLRLAACFGLGVDIIFPCGFVFDDARLRRAGMDYIDRVDLRRHTSWPAYLAAARTNSGAGRLVLLTTRAAAPYHTFGFQPGDTLLLGRESSGVPDHVHDAADHRLVIPLRPGMRSLNVAMAAAIVAAEAQRQFSLSVELP
ncbi:tRNA (cytidine/uridine-2'-O-)-methyltransferase [Dongia mobilis]|uniref:tRNA (cytidine(34)-2'-O)-methyltransferase n=1 Tax=Dongia mobilis TaxID=578943 RepID=A0A4R6WX55_9PROT|nr:tRNA (cytidine(34)-2'-O)-methyltransferase [Dongia mobilis]TDQ86384.1 tRNA (cytidine/uridine-2'-O-)-methyltransferase [Dongia mobilis]